MKMQQLKQTVLNNIGRGFENSTSKQRLQIITGVNERTVRLAIEHLRKEGQPIVSNAKHKGYFLFTGSDIDIKQARIFVGETYNRIKNLEKMIQPIKNSVNDIDQLIFGGM